jgi:hypothetical protein
MPTLLLIVAHPVRAAENLRQAPRWLGAFLIITLCLVALRLASHSHLVEATLAALPSTATAADRTWAHSILNDELLLRCAILPLRQIAGMGVFAYFLHKLCLAFAPPGRARFTHVFAFEVHAEIFNLMGGCVSLAITLLGIDGNSTGAGMFALLTTPKIFTLWYVGALAAGILTLFGFSKLMAGVLASTAWIVAAVFNALLLQSVSASMHLRM